MKLPFLSAFFLGLCACSGGDSESPPVAPEADAALEAAQEAAEDSAPESGGDAAAEAGLPSDLDQVTGIWSKVTTGEAMVVKNTCGNFYLIDFDFQYTRLSKAGATSLKLEYCKDATCTAVESGVDRTLEFASGKATFTKTDPMTLGSTCELTMQEDGLITFETTAHGRFSWKLGLTYKGSGCAQYKDPKMTGDTCEGIAESDLDKVQ